MIVDIRDDALQLYQEETSGTENHPADNFMLDSDHRQENDILLERAGVSDPECSSIPSHRLYGSSVRRLYGKHNEAPDLMVPHSEEMVNEYYNPKLLPGMFPKLFPLGTGGCEIPERYPKISFKTQIEYLLSLHDPSFRRHETFLFVAFSILQRRKAQQSVAFTTKQHNFTNLADKLISLNPSLVQSVAGHLEKEGNNDNLSNDQKKVFDVLNQLTAAASKVPGSKSAKVSHRNNIRSYVGKFGIPHLFVTLNPIAAYSPSFRVFLGNEEVDLSQRCPELLPRSEQAKRLAEDPVAGAKFFQFCVEAFFEHLLGYDLEHRKSSEAGGIFGKVQAFVGSSECTNRGSLHAHFFNLVGGRFEPK